MQGDCTFLHRSYILTVFIHYSLPLSSSEESCSSQVRHLLALILVSEMLLSLPMVMLLCPCEHTCLFLSQLTYPLLKGN